jgi:TPR repeat protein
MPSKPTLLLSLFLPAFLAWTVPAWADSYQDGAAAFERGDGETALQLLQPAAEGGHSGAQSMIGAILLEGRGTPKDEVQAAKWLARAAEQGDGDALFNLGLAYDKGLGVAQDYIQAYKFYSLASASLSSSKPAIADRALKNRSLMAAKMPPHNVAAAKRLVQSWMPKAAQP